MLGPLGPAQLACFHSWRRAGVATHFLDTEDRPLPRWLRGIVDSYDHLGPIRGLDDTALEAIGFALRARASTHLCCLGEQLAIRLWQSRARLPSDIGLLINPASTMLQLSSKMEQLRLGQEAGFQTLPTALVDADCVDALAPTLRYPLALRPDDANIDNSFKAEYIADANALRHFIASRPPKSMAVVAQPFVRGPSLVVHGSRDLQGMPGTMHAYIGHLKHQGVTVSIEPFDLPRNVLAACESFAHAVDLHGVFHFDLMLEQTTGAIWFLEVNARLGGTTAKVCASGYDEPLAMLRAFGLVAPKVPASSKNPQRPAVNRIAAIKSTLASLRGNGSLIDYPYPDRSLQLRSSLRAMLTYRDEVLTPHNPKGTLAFLSQYRP